MIALFGGTFDPVHLGHLHAAISVCEALDLDWISLLLSARPGHREIPGASVDDRFHMLQLACQKDTRLVPDDREVRRARRLARPSYTVETLEEIRGEKPGAAILWVIGSDAFEGLPGWYRWRELLDLTHLVVLGRPGDARERPAALSVEVARRQTVGRPVGEAGQIVFLNLPMLPISATEIRRTLAAGRSAADLLPVAVSTYIKDRHLYGVRSDPGSVA